MTDPREAHALRREGALQALTEAFNPLPRQSEDAMTEPRQSPNIDNPYPGVRWYHCFWGHRWTKWAPSGNKELVKYNYVVTGGMVVEPRKDVVPVYERRCLMCGRRQFEEFSP